MEFTVRSLRTDIALNVNFKEPMLGIIKEDARLSLIRRFLKTFNLPIDDLKFNNETPSGNFIHLTKSYGTAIFSLSFGLETVSATLYQAENEIQVSTVFNQLFKILGEFPIAVLRINVSQHFSSDQDVALYLKSLNPKVPVSFGDSLIGRGAFYNLKTQDKNLNLFITVVESQFVQGGLFLGVDNQFSPFSHDFAVLSETVLRNYAFTLQGLGIVIGSDTKNGR